VWEAIISIIVGKILTAAVAISNGYVGAEWHIGFPVYARVIWGMYGSYLALVQRILLGLVWFSVQSWTGGLCITAVLGAMFPSFHHLKNTMPESANMTTTQFIGWVVYNLVTIPMLYMPPDKTKRLFIIMNAISLVTLVSIMIWALSKAHGAGPLLSAPATASSGSDLGWAIVKGVTTVIGSIAVGLSMSPFYHLKINYLQPPSKPTRLLALRPPSRRPSLWAMVLNHHFGHHHAPLWLLDQFRNSTTLRHGNLESTKYRPAMAF
jgi:NCS1 family nucleobase:cation symporter-1